MSRAQPHPGRHWERRAPSRPRLPGTQSPSSPATRNAGPQLGSPGRDGRAPAWLMSLGYASRWLMLSLLLCTAPAQAARETLDTRIGDLQSQLAQAGADDRDDSLRRQLLASLERRRDLERTRRELAAMTTEPAPVAVPDSLLALDELRRQIQLLDAALIQGGHRIELLHEERVASAARLADGVAALRRVREDGVVGSPDERHAALSAQLLQAAVAEIDALLGVLQVQQSSTGARRDALAAQARSSGWTPESLRSDAAALEQRFAEETVRREQRIMQATGGRAEARAALDAAPDQEALREALGNRDLDLELARNALSNLDLERNAWQLVLRFHRDGDVGALVEARERGPAVRALLLRRHEFVASLRDQTLARLAAIDAQNGVDERVDGGELAALRAVFDERLQLLQSALLDQRRVLDLLDRLREDFGRRDDVSAGERAALMLAQLRSALTRLWNHELMAVDQVLQIDGRQTTVQRGVTVGKLVKAPLLLLLCVLLARRLTAWLERRARRRGVDEAMARMLRRWILGALVCLGVLASLGLAGIPFAAFAFVGGALAIGLGFGMQTLIKNLVSGVLVLIERPFRLGDLIEVGTLRGTVVDIDLRASVLRESDGAETLVPNSLLVEQSVRNVTFRSRATRQSLAIEVTPDSDARQVAELLEATAARHGLLLRSPEPSAQLVDLCGDALRYTLQYWIELKPGVDSGRVASDLRHMLHVCLSEAGVRMPSMARHGPICAARHLM